MSLTDFYLNSPASLVEFETIQIFHEDFSQVFYFVRNNTEGLDARLEGDNGALGPEIHFEFVPMRLQPQATRTNLDYSIQVTLGDVGEILSRELALLIPTDGFINKPVFIYRTYRSDDLTKPLFGPIDLEIETLELSKEYVAFTASAPNFNLVTTGEAYTKDRFQGLERL